MRQLYFYADLGSNHNGDITRAKKLIDAAAEAGCWGVKVQLFSADDIFAPGFAPEKPIPILKREWIPELAKHAHAAKLDFGCTIFNPHDMGLIDEHCDYIKISSYEILRADLLEAANYISLPVHISTGMATIAEIQTAVHQIKNKSVVLYHCCAEYPAPVERCNIERIKTFQNKIIHDDIQVGWSHHSDSYIPILTAVALGCSHIEMHIDLNDTAGYETHHGHCWTPSRLNTTIYMAQQIVKSIQYVSVEDAYKQERLKRADPVDNRRPHISIREKN